ncbi:MAG: O-antigen ligase family protein [Chloroflexi bacterium]|nr:O-antigen ligase family protein [Chloroflexota bacterium]
MFQKKFQQILDQVIIFSLFFLSNASAFFYLVWLTPEFVYLEAIFWAILTAIAVWVLSKYGLMSSFFENCRENWIIFPFLLFSGFSIFWSVYWEVSVSRWLILIFTVIMGGYLGLRYSIKEIIKYLSIFGAFTLFLSTIFVIFFPKIGVMDYYTIQGAWKGLYWHKNHMGIIATFANVLFMVNLITSLHSRDKYVLLWSLLYLYSLVFIYQTDSVASYMTTIFLHGIIILALLWLKFREKLRKSHYVAFLAVLALTAVALFTNIDRFFGIFNRSTSLTGRIPMWSHVFETYFSKHPMGGYGFNAFWYIQDHRVEIGLAAGYPDPIVIADNGFWDILINTGYIGLILFLLFYCSAWWSSIAYANKARDINGFFPVIMMLYSLAANITWSLIFENEGFLMLVLVSIMFSLSRITLAEREASNSGPG